MLLENLSYDPLTGIFRWRRSRGPRKGGSVAGHSHLGYVRISINDREYLAHRLAWLAVYGEMPAGNLDHKNGDRADNRIANLRLATQSENMRNSKPYRRKILGLKGTDFHKTQKQWRARITIDRRVIYLGWFDTSEAAHAAYCAAASKHFGEFFNVGQR